jgi:hypothetical protein
MVAQNDSIAYEEIFFTLYKGIIPDKSCFSGGEARIFSIADRNSQMQAPKTIFLG